MKRRRPVFAVKPVILTAVFFILLLFLLRLAQLFKDLDYFKIKYILSAENNLIELSHLKGCNIFSIDLERESRYISELYPSYKKIKLIRVLPDRLFVDFVKRKPVAYVRLYRYFLVDDDLVLFNASEQLGSEDLPIILGLDTKIFGVRPGKKCNILELTLAVNIIKELKMNKALKDYRIKKIEVLNSNNASFFIADGIEVKIGLDYLKNKVNILGSLFIQAKNDLSNIKYIDLRFKEPVIKLKNQSSALGV